MNKVESIGWMAWRFRGWLLVGFLGFLAGFALVWATSDESLLGRLDFQNIGSRTKLNSSSGYVPKCLATFDPSCRLA